jgi:hypothetical protein
LRDGEGGRRRRNDEKEGKLKKSKRKDKSNTK